LSFAGSSFFLHGFRLAQNRNDIDVKAKASAAKVATSGIDLLVDGDHGSKT